MTTLFGDIEPNHDVDFSRFWNEYPRKVAKQAALVAWRRLRPSPSLQVQIYDALDWQRASWKEDRFIPHASTWLNQRRWEDERPKATRRFSSFVGDDELSNLLVRAGVNQFNRVSFFQTASLAHADDALVLTIQDGECRAYVSRNFLAAIQNAANERGKTIVLR